VFDKTKMNTLRELAQASHSRLGKSVHRSELKTSRLGEISRSKLSSFLATSLGWVSLAWARDQVAQPRPESPRRDTRTRTKNETLQLSLRRIDSLGRYLQGFNPDHALNSPNIAQFAQQNIPLSEDTIHNI